ncbi:hypothetical protein DM02DRAFT_610946 [Periconia macrospinosa]|uniref:Uncharacterized protein n=1 Tax=Periconia macrospinosa TaxID=97972 RepID=A0A2V1E429_9PLEO|nr:hypothetical protein DM02DRAFT_610946 [Periconia macrospinosa]
MPTENPSSSGFLAPGWLSTLSRRSSKSSLNDQNSDPGMIVAPRRPSASSEGKRSRSRNSSLSDGAREVLERISTTFPRSRTPSIASQSGLGSPAPTLKNIKTEMSFNWWGAFINYNKIVTNRESKNTENAPFQSKEFEEICKELTKQCGGYFSCGLPESTFDLALLWCPAGKIHRKTGDGKGPSWSWVGWYGAGVNFPFDPFSCPDYRHLDGNLFMSEIVSYALGPETSWAVRRERDESRLRLDIPYYYPAGKFRHAEDTDTLRFRAFTISGAKFNLRQLDVDDEYEVVDENKQNHVQNDGGRQPTQSIPYTQIWDDKDQHCGIIMDFRANIYNKPSEQNQPQHVFKYVKLSRSRLSDENPKVQRGGGNIIHPPGAPVWKDGAFLWDQSLESFDEEKFEKHEWCMFNVMLIEQQVGGWWERKAIGQIHEVAWKAQNPQNEEIILR